LEYVIALFLSRVFFPQCRPLRQHRQWQCPINHSQLLPTEKFGKDCAVGDVGVVQGERGGGAFLLPTMGDD